MNTLFQHVIAMTVLSVALLPNWNIMSAAETGIVKEVVIVVTQTTDRVDITTKSGVAYTNCTITSVEPNSITFFHATGIAKIPFTDISDELQAKYNYNPTNAVAYTQSVNQKQEEEVKRRKSEAAIEEKDFTGVFCCYIPTNRICDESDINKEVVPLVLKKGGGVVMAEIHYRSSHSGGTRTTSLAGIHDAMQRSVNAPKIKERGREIFIVGISEKLADGDEWKGKIYKCGIFDVYTGHTYHMYATTKELANEILQKQPLLLTESKEKVAEPPIALKKKAPPQGIKNPGAFRMSDDNKKHKKLGQ